MNLLEQFIAVYEPENDVVFRQMLEQVIQEIKNKSQPKNEVIGMRDYFAGQAMVGVLTMLRGGNEGLITVQESTSKYAYEWADAMMEARKAKNDS